MQTMHNKVMGKGKMRLISFVYLGLMLIFYVGYVLLDNYRLIKSQFWANMDGLTGSELQSIQQLNFWINFFEISFLGLFILATIVLYRFRKNRIILNYFIISHLCIFSFLFLLGYVLSFFLIAPIGNLTQPLLLPFYLLIVVVIYAVIMTISHRLIK